jgi:hypothetical protein
MLRIQARIPVVVMGETGCGKTSLVKFLAEAVGAQFRHLDFHAGITDNNIPIIRKSQVKGSEEGGGVVKRDLWGGLETRL